MIDFVIPKKNEKQLLAMAMDLGYSGICFIYDVKHKNEVNNAIKLEGHGDFEIRTAIVSNKLPKNFDHFILDSVSQSILKQKPLFVYDIEGDVDFIHQKDSGMNHVLCKMMKEKNVAYAISLDNLIKHKDRAKLLGRIQQNIKLCNKYGTNVGLFSFADKPLKMRNPNDIKAFARVLGIDNFDYPKTVKTQGNHKISCAQHKNKVLCGVL